MDFPSRKRTTAAKPIVSPSLRRVEAAEPSIGVVRASQDTPADPDDFAKMALFDGSDSSATSHPSEAFVLNEANISQEEDYEATNRIWGVQAVHEAAKHTRLAHQLRQGMEDAEQEFLPDLVGMHRGKRRGHRVTSSCPTELFRADHTARNILLRSMAESDPRERSRITDNFRNSTASQIFSIPEQVNSGDVEDCLEGSNKNMDSWAVHGGMDADKIFKHGLRNKSAPTSSPWVASVTHKSMDSSSGNGGWGDVNALAADRSVSDEMDSWFAAMGRSREMDADKIIDHDLRNNEAPNSIPEVVSVTHESMDSSAVHGGQGDMDASAATRCGGGEMDSSSVAGNRSRALDADKIIKHGLRNNDAPNSTPGVVSVTHRKTYSAIGTPTSPVKAESDACAKAGLRRPRAATAGAVPTTAILNSSVPGSIPSEGVPSKVDVDARLKAGLRRVNRDSQLEAVPAANDLRMSSSAGTDDGHPDAHKKAGLRRSHLDTSVARAVPMPNGTDLQMSSSPGTHDGHPNTQSKAGLRGSHVRSATAPGAVRMHNVRITAPYTVSQADENAILKARFRNRPPSTDEYQNILSYNRDILDDMAGRGNLHFASIPPAEARPHPEVTHVPETFAREGIDPEEGISAAENFTSSSTPTPSGGDNFGCDNFAEEYPATESDDDGTKLLSQKKRIHWILLLCLLSIIAVVVGVVVGTATPSRDDGSATQSTANTTSQQYSSEPFDMVPISQVFPTLILPDVTVEAIESQQKTLPQVQAFTWLVDDPHGRNYSEAQRLQRFALATFFYATQGDEWLEDSSVNNWLDYNMHECEWFSLAAKQGHSVCDGYEKGSSIFDHYDYKALVLSGDDQLGQQLTKRVKGQLVPELALLKNLAVLDLGFQSLKGSIPSELGLLSSTLSRIILYDNQLTGTLPESLFSFVADLWLSKNRLQPSTIPTEVGVNTNLRSLLMTATKLRGTLPKELFETGSSFVSLLLGENELEGPIPTEIGLATYLTELQLSKNEFSGTVPSELALLQLLSLLDLYANDLSGTISSELGNLGQLTSLSVLGNEMEGTIPTELARLSKLKELKLSTGASRMGGLLGPIPSEFFPASPTAPSFPLLEALWIEDTNLSGTIPTEIARMTNLISLRMGYNAETRNGTIPTELGLLSDTLRELWLGDLHLGSFIPSELGKLTKLKILDLQGNELSGTIPTELGTLSELNVLHVQGNPGLEGSIPDRLCKRELTFGCSSNSLCGCECGPCT